jgi:tetratricopeptide (TPR) repeat protein
MNLCTVKGVAMFAATSSLAFTAAAAQASRADSLLNAGGLQRAESLYYAAAQAHPRDPASRWALGRYLVSRGAPRVGMTLFEEAIQFGGDASRIGADLAPVYLSLGEYQKLSAFRAAPISNTERERARWLVAHPSKMVAPDSSTSVQYKKSNESSGIGAITLRVNGRTIDATVSTHVHGIVLADTSAAAKHVRAFRAPGGSTAQPIPAIADSIGLGRYSLSQFPVSIAPLAGAEQALIGMDVLARFAPTFDPRSDRDTLHVSGSVPKVVSGADQFSTLLTSNDLRVLQAGGWLAVDQAPLARILSTRRWTFDAKRGQLTIER